MRRTLRIFGGFAAGIALLWVVASAGLYAAMRQTPARFGAVMAHVPQVMMAILPFEPLWMSARAGSLVPGDLAPDFELPMLHGEGPITLAALTRNKPVVLIFGSYT
jgi:hypothetical protein